MALASRRPTVACCALAGLLAVAAGAGGATVYRYVDPDGRIVYSDRQPPADAKDVETKRLTPNLIETDKVSLEAQRAQDHFPVTLYTFSCGDVCDRAEALLNRRGVPFTRVNVQLAEGAEKLKTLTGDLQAPVLQAGDKLMVRGFSDTQWQALLDDAGYPKTPPLRRPAPAPEPVKSPVAQPVTPAAEPVGGGYPKN